MATTVNKERVNQDGIELIANAKKMYDSLEVIERYINDSKNYFDSEAGDELRKKFKASAAQFETFRDFLKSYGEFLQNFSGNVKTYEDGMKDVISSIPQP